MRFMVNIKSDVSETSDGSEKSAEGDYRAALQASHEELARAGVLLAGECLHPSLGNARLTFSGRTVSVAQGPFADAGGRVVGFWLLDVKSGEEAVAWARRCLAPTNLRWEVEIRRVVETSDFSEAIDARAGQEPVHAR